MRILAILLVLLLGSPVAYGGLLGSSSTTTTLTSNANAAPPGQPITMTARVSTTGALALFAQATPNPIGGYVELYNDKNELLQRVRVTEKNTPIVGYVHDFDRYGCGCYTYYYYGRNATIFFTQTAASDVNAYYAVYTGEKFWSNGSKSANLAMTGRVPDVYAIKRQGASSTEVHVLSASSAYKAFSLHAATALQKTGAMGDWWFGSGDYNKDGVTDLYAIAKQGASAKTEVHVLNGKGGYKTYLLHKATALAQTGSNFSWVFDIGDYNADGTLDLYAIGREGASGKTEVHVLDGANGFTSYLTHSATILGKAGSDGSWNFALADYNQDGRLDLYAIKKMGGSGKTEVHVLNGGDGFKSYLTQRATVLYQTGTNHQWAFDVADYDLDGTPDIFAINREGGSNKTEVHVMDGANHFASYLLNSASALHPTGLDGSWQFLAVP